MIEKETRHPWPKALENEDRPVCDVCGKLGAEEWTVGPDKVFVARLCWQHKTALDLWLVNAKPTSICMENHRRLETLQLSLQGVSDARENEVLRVAALSAATRYEVSRALFFLAAVKWIADGKTGHEKKERK